METYTMLDLKKTLLCPEHKSTFLGDRVGAQGLILIGVGKGGERGFHMTYRLTRSEPSWTKRGSVWYSSIRRRRYGTSWIRCQWLPPVSTAVPRCCSTSRTVYSDSLSQRED